MDQDQQSEKIQKKVDQMEEEDNQGDQQSQENVDIQGQAQQQEAEENENENENQEEMEEEDNRANPEQQGQQNNEKQQENQQGNNEKQQEGHQQENNEKENENQEVQVLKEGIPKQNPEVEQMRDIENRKNQQANQKDIEKKKEELPKDIKAIDSVQNVNQSRKDCNQQENIDKMVAQQEVVQSQIKKILVQEEAANKKQGQYINRLEVKLNSQLKLLNETSKKFQTQAKFVALLTSQNKKYSQVIAKSSKRIQQLEYQDSQKQVNIQKLKDKVQNLEKQLQEYKQIGDVIGLKRKVEELQFLLEAQHKELDLFRNYKCAGMDQQLNRQKISGKQYLERVGELQSINQENKAQIKGLQRRLQGKSKQNAENLQILNRMDHHLKQKIELIAKLEEKIQIQAEQYRIEKQTLKEKIVSLEKYLQSIVQNPQQNNEQHINEQNMSREKSQNQKQLLFREYLKLDFKYKALEEDYKAATKKYEEIWKGLRNSKKQMVPKKDYQEILAKYKKCRVCLQKTISENKMLKNAGGNPSLLQEKSNVFMNQEQSNIKKFTQIFGQHAQKSAEIFKQTSQIIESINIEELKNQLKNKETELQFERSDRDRLEKLSTILQNELTYKNLLLDRAASDLKNTKAQYYKLQKQKEEIQSTLLNNFSSAYILRRLESKSATLIAKNRNIISERNQWKELYQAMKQKYELFISREHQISQVNFQPNSQIKDVVSSQTEKLSHTILKPVYITQETQTQGLNQLYYKQIRQTLSAVKKFPQMIKVTTADYQKIRGNLDQLKKRYEQTNERFNLRFKQLQIEKGKNDNWRQQVKRQVISQFEDIRQLIEDDRLLNCLRKAKNLIEYLQQNGEEQGEIVA